MRDHSQAELYVQATSRRRRSEIGRRVFMGIAVVSLISMGYLAALAVHWHDEARRIREREPIVTFRGDLEQFSLPPLPSSPRTVDDLIRLQDQIVAGVAKCAPATVAIAVVSDRFRTGLAGSGVVVTEDGYILTAGHVSAEAGREVSILFSNGRSASGETLGMSMISDTGMIKITDEGKYPFVPLAKAGDIEIGEWCFALGYPGGFEKERGTVARVGRLIGTSLSTIRTDCKLLGGDSGGPLFNLRGELIGIHSRISDSPDENYHAPISAFHRGWQDLKEKEVIHFWGERTNGYLGVTNCAPLEDDAGLLIREVAAHSPAAGAGVAAGDILTHIDGQKIIDRLEYSAAIESKQPGESIDLRFRRGGHAVLMKIALGEKPETVR